MDTDISKNFESGKFKYRVAAVALHKNKILLAKEGSFDFWNLPGGKVSILETSESSLKREIKEEVGIEPSIKKLLWTVECLYYFEAFKINYHEFVLYYLVDFPKNAEIYKKNSFFGIENTRGENWKIHLEWIDINLLEDINLKPTFLKQALKKIPDSPSHLIFDEILSH